MASIDLRPSRNNIRVEENVLTKLSGFDTIRQGTGHCQAINWMDINFLGRFPNPVERGDAPSNSFPSQSIENRTQYSASTSTSDLAIICYETAEVQDKACDPRGYCWMMSISADS
jgi:hypothetical protein